MKKRNYIVLIIAILLMAMTSTGFAAETRGTLSTRVEVTPMIPDIIVVTVPGNADVVINPLGLPIEIDGESTTEQIVMEPVAIHNLGLSSVKVDVEIVAEIDENSDLRLRPETTKGTGSTRKNAFVYFEIQATNDPDKVTWDKGYNQDKHLILRDNAKMKKGMVILEAGDDESPATNKCYGAFRLTGDCIAEPKDPWTKDDKITAVVSFTFTPMPRS